MLNGYDVIKTALLKQGPDFDGRPKSRRVSLVNPKFLGMTLVSIVRSRNNLAFIYIGS